jgi:ATP-binding cassette subfamily C protein LapB
MIEAIGRDTPEIQAKAAPSYSQDPLRDGLVLLCRQFGRAASIAELGEGLALVKGRLPLNLAPRALRRVGLTARVLDVPLMAISPTLLPVLLQLRDGQSLVLVERRGQDVTVLDAYSGGGQRTLSLPELEAQYSGSAVFARAQYRPNGRAANYASEPAEHWLKAPLKACWRAYAATGVAALMTNLLAIASALFAMQVYDRVVPNDAFDTLWILASGVVLAMLLEFVLRSLRAHILDVTGKRLDLHLSSVLFNQVLQIRLQSKPASVGAFSTQIRAFESVREFFTSSTAAAISDLPFVFLFLLAIVLIGGSVVWVPLLAILLMLLPGLLAQKKTRSTVAPESARRGGEERRIARSHRKPGNSQGKPSRRSLVASMGNAHRRTLPIGGHLAQFDRSAQPWSAVDPAAGVRRRINRGRLPDQQR